MKAHLRRKARQRFEPQDVGTLWSLRREEYSARCLTDVNIGLLVILAISAMSVYGVALGGWASNNKYALLGGLLAYVLV